MLHQFPDKIEYLEADDLRALQGSEPKSEKEALERLSRLLPLLGDQIVPVWSSPRLPFQPVALITFCDKQGKALVATVCETGLLAVIPANRPESQEERKAWRWTFLQIPDVWSRRGSIHGLWASRSIRPFGTWTELVIQVLSRSEPKEKDRYLVYRTLVRTDENGTIELRPALEETRQDAKSWQAEEKLPKGFEWLEKAYVFCGSGNDPFDPRSTLNSNRELRDKAIQPKNLVACSRDHAIWVEDGNQLCRFSRRIHGDSDHSVVSMHLADEVETLDCLAPLDTGPLRALVATTQRTLAAYELKEDRRAGDAERWQEIWSQNLRSGLSAIDSAIPKPEEVGVSRDFPDFFAATNAREVVRFAWFGPENLEARWSNEVKKLARFLPSQETEAWLAWCDQKLTELLKRKGKKSLPYRRLVHYLALDRVFRDPSALEDPEIRKKLGELYEREHRVTLMIPAFRRLVEELERAERAENLQPQHIELAWECYDQKPFLLQEILDAHFRGLNRRLAGEPREALGACFEILCSSAQDSSAFFVPKGPPRKKAGVHLMRAIRPFLASTFEQPDPGAPVRNILPVARQDGIPRFLAIRDRRIDLYRVLDDNKAVELDLDDSAILSLGEDDCAPKLTFRVPHPDLGTVIVLATLHGHLGSWVPGHEIQWFDDSPWIGSPGGATLLPEPSPERPTLVLCENRGRDLGAHLWRFALGPSGELVPLQETPLHTHLRDIHAMVALPGRSGQVIVAEDADLVALELAEDREPKILGRRHLGSTILGLGLTEKEGQPWLLTCTTRNGLLFAIRIDDSLEPWRRIQWIRQIPHGTGGMVSGLEHRDLVGIVNTQGRLIFLGYDGDEKLDYRPYDPVESAAFFTSSERSYLAATHASGVLTILRQTDPSETELEKARQALAGRRDADEPNDNEAWRLGDLLHRFDRGKPFRALYPDHGHWWARHALSWLAANASPLGAAPPPLEVSILDHRSVADLLLHLPEQHEQREALERRAFAIVRRRLRPPTSPKTGTSGHPSLRKETTLLAVMLNSMDRRLSTLPTQKYANILKALEQQDFGHLFETNDWMPFLVAERLLGDFEGQGQASEFLDLLLKRLIRYPLQVTQAASTLVSGALSDHETVPVEQTLRGLVQLGQALLRQAPPEEIESALGDLAKVTRSWRGDSANEGSALGLFARYLAFLTGDEASEEPNDDPLSSFLSLQSDAGTEAKVASFLGLLLRQTIGWRPRPRPDDPDALLEHQTWLDDTSNRLRSLRNQEPDDDGIGYDLREHKNWRKIRQELLERGRRQFEQLLEARETELRTQVSVQLRTVDSRRPRPHTVMFELEAIPMALRRTADISYTVDFSRPGGLSAVTRGNRLTFGDDIEWLDPEHLERRSATIHGATAPDQERVRFEIRLRWADLSQEKTLVRWLSLPPTRQSASSREAPLPEAVPAWTQHLVETVHAAKSSLVVLIDEDLGRTGLVRRCEGAGRRTVDLDSAMEDLGPGRAYPDALDLRNLRAGLRDETLPVEGGGRDDGPTGRQLLVSRSDDLWRRLLENPSLDSTLHEIITFVSHPGRDRAPLVFFVSTEIGQRLRRRFAKELRFLDAFRLPEEMSKEKNKAEAVWQEAAAWLIQGWPHLRPAQGRSALHTLGGDLRFASLLRRTSPQTLDSNRPSIKPKFDQAIAQFLAGSNATAIYRMDFSGLPPRSVQLLMLAANTTTTLPFSQVGLGMVAAQEVDATPSRPDALPKTILEPGERVGGRAVSALGGDRAHATRTARIAGYSPGRPFETTSTLRYFPHFFPDLQQTRHHAAPLVAIGVGEEVAGQVHIREPYRAALRSMLETHDDLQGVYRRLTGRESILEGSSLAELQRLSAENLREIQPLDPVQAEAIAKVAKIWSALRSERQPSVPDLQRAFRDLTGKSVEVLLPSDSSTSKWSEVLPSSKDLLLRLSLGNPQDRHFGYLAILSPHPPRKARTDPDFDLLTTTHHGEAHQELGNGQPRLKPRLIVLRPDRTEAPSSEEWTEFNDDELLEAALHPDYQREFWRRVRADAGLKALTPFQAYGALPPGSPIFVGREEQVDFIVKNIESRSFLIVGSRQIGKTSLLNHLRYLFEREKNREILSFDLQKGPEVLLQELKAKVGTTELATLEGVFSELIEKKHRQGVEQIVFFNEIDDLLRDNPQFLRAIRGFHDEGKARFVMTGYFQAAAAGRDPSSPLFHLTSSPDGRPFIILAELSDTAAKKLIDLLEKPPLELEWDSPKDKKMGTQALLEHSYRIPHLLQSLCIGLIERLEQKKRLRLRGSDVVAVARQPKYSAWHHVNTIELANLLRPGEQTDDEGATHLIHLLLLIAVKKIYFEGDPPPIEHAVHQRDPRTLGFDADQLRDWYPQVLQGLLRKEELEVAKTFLERIDLEDLLFGLSLTLILSYDPERDRHYFQSNLYPIEINRQLRARNQLLDDRILNRLLPLYRSWTENR